MTKASRSVTATDASREIGVAVAEHLARNGITAATTARVPLIFNHARPHESND